MAVAIDRVPMWLVLARRIGHAVASTENGWHYIACGAVTPNGDLTKTTPKRICRACRRILKTATLGRSGVDR